VTIKCDYCSRRADLVSGRKIYPHRPDLFDLQFWLCTRCDAWVGCHKNSNAIPLGRLADEELRMAKQGAHAAFDPIWKQGIMDRKQAYRWLADALCIPAKSCHIGMFTPEQCYSVVRVCNQFKRAYYGKSL